MKRTNKILALLLILLLIPTHVFALEKINASLIQPGIYKAKGGTPYPVTLQMQLPANVSGRYQSIAATLQMDSVLDVQDVALEDATIPKSAYTINKTFMTNTGKNIISFNITNLKAFDKSPVLRLKINAVIKAGESNVNNVENILALSVVDKSGAEEITQENYTAPTVADVPVEITVNPLTTGEQYLTGTGPAGAQVVVYKGRNIITEGPINPDGTFTLPISPQRAGTALTVEFNQGTIQTTRDITVAKGNMANDPYQAQKTKLMDYADAVEKLPTSGLSKEQALQGELALTNAKYLMVKSDVTKAELDSGIASLETVYQSRRPAYMVGTGAGTFAPTKNMTKAEVAALFTKARADENPVRYTSNFKDVKKDAWYAHAVGYMERMGIISGKMDGTFGPADAITRAEFATMLARYTGVVSNGGPSYKDVSDKHWAKQYIDAVSYAGYMQGTPDGKFNPNAKITRAEVATAMNKAMDRTPNETIISKYTKNPFSDVAKDKWYYNQVLEAAGN